MNHTSISLKDEKRSLSNRLQKLNPIYSILNIKSSQYMVRNSFLSDIAISWIACFLTAFSTLMYYDVLQRGEADVKSKHSFK